MPNCWKTDPDHKVVQGGRVVAVVVVVWRKLLTATTTTSNTKKSRIPHQHLQHTASAAHTFMALTGNMQPTPSRKEPQELRQRKCRENEREKEKERRTMKQRKRSRRRSKEERGKILEGCDLDEARVPRLKAREGKVSEAVVAAAI
ncbi:hypothetical protein E2C01_091502 [Portunus trituberculatus]|uniref:Uncharacterized protein n=1 Tax=Portunus trituberculatus TaxID=210409 RepID=A0A5B7JV74_PORTR|nr:hypothetical protein [Portunus trituberculatus]